MERINNKNINSIIDSQLDVDAYLIGLHEEKLYIAHNEKSEIDQFIEFLINENYFEKILEKLKETKKDELKKNESQVIAKLNLYFNIETYFRVISKICFNVLAATYGSEVALDSSFDKIRKYILEGGENTFSNFCPDLQSDVLKYLNPDQTNHFCIITSVGEKVLGTLGLYGMQHFILLSDNYNGGVTFNNGIVCEWKNKIEKRIF